MFEAFPKIARLSRDCVVTEKIDGTNAHVWIEHKDLLPADIEAKYILAEQDDQVLLAGSRSKFIRPGDDNFGFAVWAQNHAAELFTLGHGRHYGEWWGAGIQRRYGLTEKRFSLFNTHRWGDAATRPACCHVVPVLWQGTFDTLRIEQIVDDLRTNGSKAAPGFADPEGVIVFHTASSTMFKKTVKDDEKPKGSKE